MSYKMIINDVVNDYKKAENIDFDEKSAYVELERLCESRKDMDDESIYGLCMYYLFFAKNHKDDVIDGSEDIIEKKFIMSLPVALDDLLDMIVPFKWIPTSLSRVTILSREIFEEAKEAFYGGRVSAQDSEKKLDEIIKLKAEIENEDYKYRNRSEIMSEYERELSECILDIDTINGEKIIQSIRLGKYIEEIGEMQEVQLAPNFNDTNPFSVPNKLF